MPLDEDHARHRLFAQPGGYDARVRPSNGGAARRPTGVLMDHHPLGEVMCARKWVYFRSRRVRR